MLRKATPQDMDALVRFRCDVFGGSPEAAAGWLQHIAGLDNILLVLPEEDGADPAAMLGALPVECLGRQGVLFSGMATRPDWQGRGLMAKLIDGCLRAYAADGCEFAVTAQVSAHNAQTLASLGFQSAFPLRVVDKQITRNLWAQAEFDNLTVRRLTDLRLRFQPGCVCLPEASMAETMTQMYRRGVTALSTERGYGLYYQANGILQFVELQAENDHSADILLQAAREKTGAERARLILSENQSLYLGEGRRCSYAMIRFLKEPFSVRNGYFRLLSGE